MKKSVFVLMAAALVAMFATGCGTPMYEVNDEEATIIASYCANCVAKFNRFQDDGMVFVVNKTSAEQLAAITGEAPQPVQDTTIPEDETDDGLDINFDDLGGSDFITISDEHYVVSPLSIGEILGYPELNVVCNDVSVTKEYKEGTYLLLTPSDGYSYLVLKINISNPGTESVACDFISKDPKFYIELSNGTRSVSSGTILLDDFYTYQGTLAPGQSADTVALVEIPSGEAQELSKVKIFLESMGTTTELPLLQ